MKLTLAEKDAQKWGHNVILFLAPLGVLYLTTIIGVLSQPFHVFSYKDLVPDTFAQGGMVLWLLNVALDYLRKLK